MPEQEDAYPAPKKRSKILTVIVWMIVLLLVPACGAWVIGRRFYWFDLLASEQMLIGWVAVVLTLGVLISRRRKAFVVCVVLVCVSFWPVMNGRVWVLPNVDPAHKTEGVFRIISSNINPKNADWKQDLEQLMSYDADAIVLLEVSPDLSRTIQRLHYLDNTAYPYWLHRAWVDKETSPCFILSPQKIEPLDTSSMPGSAQHLLYTKINNSFGSLIVGLAHPRSPRTKQRWIAGEIEISAQTQMIDRLNLNNTEPIVLCADINAGPAQRRARLLRIAGLRMSKPVFHVDGSFPADNSVPKALRVQLDDIWSSADINPVAWSMIKLNGSDHQSVIVDFQIDYEQNK